MLRTLAFLALAALTLPAYADDRSQTQQQIEATRQDIAELKKVLTQLQQARADVQKDLRGTEVEMGKLQKQVDQLQQQLKDTESELQRLETQKKNSRVRALNSKS